MNWGFFMANEVGRVNSSDFPGEVQMYVGAELPLYPEIGERGRQFARDNFEDAAVTGNPEADGYWLVIRVEPDGSGSLLQIPPHGANS